MSLRTLTVSLIIGMLALAALPLYAGGGRETRLEEARELIEARQYNQAILVLSSLVDDRPEYLDRAQQLLDQIFRVRDRYRETYQELVDTLAGDGDPEVALALIDELTELDPNPNDEARRQLGDARARVAALYLGRSLGDVMDRAAALLRAGDVLGAVDLYVEALPVLASELDLQRYSNIVQATVEEATGTLEALAPAAREAAQRIDTAAAELAAAAAAAVPVPPEADGTGTGDALPVAELRAALRVPSAYGRRAEQAGTVLQALDAQLREGGQLERDEVFFAAAAALALGRPGLEEGLAYALDLLWTEQLAAAAQPLTATAAEHLAAGIESYRGGALDAADASLRQAELLYEGAVALDALRGAALQLRADGNLGAADVERARAALPAMLRTQNEAMRATSYLALADVRARAGAGLVAESDVASVEAQLAALEADSLTLATEAARWGDVLERLAALQRLEVPTGELLAVATAMRDRLTTELDQVGGLAAGLVAPLVAGEAEQLATRVDAGGVQVEEARQLLAGVPGQSEEEPLRRYPARAQQQLDQVLAVLPEVAQRAGELVRRWGPEGFAGTQTEPLAAALAALAEVAADAAALDSEAGQLRARAAAAAFEATRLRRDGERFIQQARSAIAAQRFAPARESIETAGEVLVESLALQEDAAVRELLDDVLADLSAQIVAAENVQVVREVRTLIDRGRNLYNDGAFQEAEGALVRAQDRWADTNPEENSEITNWLNIVRSALEVRSGRVLAAGDPLFTPMTQNLNFAEQNFQRGTRLVRENRNRDALDAFQLAESFLDKVRITFPYNSSARLLSLRITQTVDPEGFVARLSEEFDQALRLRTSDPQEAYAQLKTIEELQPTFPGLAGAILNLEYDLRIKIRPPDPAVLAESNRLLNEARSIVESGDSTRFEFAVAQLNSALELNPNNQAAVALKDQLQIATGGGVQSVLASTAQEQFRRAEQRYIDGDFVGAFRIVQQLLDDESNHGYAPLLDLKRRIDRNL